MKKTAILILAAGSSSRMGTIKQLLPYKNTTLLEWAIEQAQKSNTKNVFCVLGANREIIEKHISKKTTELIYNPDYQEGLSTSIVNGIKYLQTKEFESVLIMLADQPHLTFEYLNSLIKISEENPSKIIASNYQDKIGVPAIFSEKYFSELLSLKGDKGAKAFLQNHRDIIIEANTPQNLIDIDTPDDYQHLLKQ
ncbi:nucleotidyltransferase family protein [Tenacibaculum sp.]|uniref:nucleotidyltransferase family protein n=1 Tax=Tenacibaculum sp. TaxID=1906242 RepID=UPI003D139D0F